MRAPICLSGHFGTGHLHQLSFPQLPEHTNLQLTLKNRHPCAPPLLFPCSSQQPPSRLLLTPPAASRWSFAPTRPKSAPSSSAAIARAPSTPAPLLTSGMMMRRSWPEEREVAARETWTSRNVRLLLSSHSPFLESLRRILHLSFPVWKHKVYPCIFNTVVVEFATGLFDQLKELSQEMDNENKFVDTMLDKTAAKYPNKNVLIFHNQASQLVDFTGSTHEHVELPLAFQRTKGYEILVFDTGRFKLAGDGGYLNVGYLGVWEKKDGWVIFKKR